MDKVIAFSWKLATLFSVVTSVLFTIIWLACENCREGVLKLFAALPLWVSILFLAFCWLTVIVMAVSYFQKRKKPAIDPAKSISATESMLESLNRKVDNCTASMNKRLDTMEAKIDGKQDQQS